jgi:hypothetical protein
MTTVQWHTDLDPRPPYYEHLKYLQESEMSLALFFWNKAFHGQNFPYTVTWLFFKDNNDLDPIFKFHHSDPPKIIFKDGSYLDCSDIWYDYRGIRWCCEISRFQTWSI